MDLPQVAIVGSGGLHASVADGATFSTSDILPGNFVASGRTLATFKPKFTLYTGAQTKPGQKERQVRVRVAGHGCNHDPRWNLSWYYMPSLWDYSDPYSIWQSPDPRLDFNTSLNPVTGFEWYGGTVPQPATVLLPGQVKFTGIAGRPFLQDYIITVPVDQYLELVPETSLKFASFTVSLEDIPDLKLAVDGDRDGTIRFDATDETTAQKPYRFWINDNYDVGNDDQAEDQEVVGGLRNSSNNYIDNQRDLEDFTRLHINLERLPLSLLQDGSVTASFVLEALESNPVIRLYAASEADGGNRYLTELAASVMQSSVIYRTSVVDVAFWRKADLPAIFWPLATGNSATKYFLFEGVSAGKAKIKLVLHQGGQVAAESEPVHLDLKPVTRMYEHFTAGDTADLHWSRVPTNYTHLVNDSRTYSGSDPETDDYILFVHGWRMKPWERRAFASTAYKRLWWQGYQGRFGLFSWPTEWTFGNPLLMFGPLNYDRSERKAWLSAEAFRKLLVELNTRYSGKVRVTAHSMGNVVVSEALQLATEADQGQLVHTYAACQAALASHCFDAAAPTRELNSTGGNLDSGTFNIYANYWVQPGLPNNTYTPYLEGVSGAGRFVNLFNASDIVLRIWNVNQDFKPDRNSNHPNENYYYSLNFGFYVGLLGLPTRYLRIPMDRYEIFAHAAEARCYPLGAQPGVRGPFFKNGQVQELDLESNFNWKDELWEHSAQFRSTNMRRHQFWNRLMSEFGLPLNQ